jgi:hypothetical protein
MMLDERFSVEVTGYNEAIAALPGRLANLNIRYEDFDDLCFFPAGLTGKCLGPSQVKRFGIEKFFDALRGAGLRIRLEEDPEQTERMLKRIAENYNPRQAYQARPNNHSHPSNKMVESVLNYLANKKGGLTRLNDAVKMAYSNRARLGWKTRRKGGVVDFAGYLENVSRLANAPALPEFVEQESPSQNPCSAEANAA